MSNPFNYKSVLAIEIRRFIEIKEAKGFSTLRAKWILKEIDDYAQSLNLDIPIITKELIEGWRKTRTNDALITLYAKYLIWSQLTKQMNRNGYPCYIPKLPKQPKSEFIPYIFTHEQIVALIKECDKTVVSDRHMNASLISLPALFRLLYSTGLRISEALSIRNEDVKIDQQYIHIRKTKNGSERIVPISESLAQVLKQYESYRNKMPVSGLSSPKHLYFVKLDGTYMRANCVYQRFRKLMDTCGIPFIGSHHGPRVHDLRHTFAVHALTQMGRNKMDLYTGLPILSTCLGHKSLSATEKYVRLTCSMYPELEELCSPINAFIYPKL